MADIDETDRAAALFPDDKLIRSCWAPYPMATVHPSSLLRAPDKATRQRETALFIANVKQAAAGLLPA